MKGVESKLMGKLDAIESEVKMASCISVINKDIETINRAYRRLQPISSASTDASRRIMEDKFKDACANSGCQEALEDLLFSI